MSSSESGCEFFVIVPDSSLILEFESERLEAIVRYEENGQEPTQKNHVPRPFSMKYIDPLFLDPLFLDPLFLPDNTLFRNAPLSLKFFFFWAHMSR